LKPSGPLRNTTDQPRQTSNTFPPLAVEMGFFSALKNLYSLDTVDPRLTAPSGNKRKQSAAAASTASTEFPEPQPSRWKTPEFYGYYFVFAVVVPLMFKVTYDLSRGWPIPSAMLWLPVQANYG